MAFDHLRDRVEPDERGPAGRLHDVLHRGPRDDGKYDELPAARGRPAPQSLEEVRQTPPGFGLNRPASAYASLKTTPTPAVNLVSHWHLVLQAAGRGGLGAGSEELRGLRGPGSTRVQQLDDQRDSAALPSVHHDVQRAHQGPRSGRLQHSERHRHGGKIILRASILQKRKFPQRSPVPDKYRKNLPCCCS